MRKRLFAALVCAMMVTGLLPAAALAGREQTELYINQGSIVIGKGTVSGYTSSGVHVTKHNAAGYRIIGGGTTTTNTITVTGGEHSITLHNVNINASFAIQSDAVVDLELNGANVLDSSDAGLHVPSGATVEITGTGSLSATGSFNCAGIGGGEYGDGGAVTISGGNVKAKGSSNSADIGGTLKNANGVDVYLVTLTLDGASISNSTPIASLNATGISYTYGMDGVKPLDGNKLYLYLPEGTEVKSITTGETPARLFINQDNTPITVANNHDNTGTLTEATATISDVTVSGTKGSLLTSVDAIITLTGIAFGTLSADADVSSWFTNMPAGLSAKIKAAVASGATTAQVIFSGTPTATGSAEIAVTIPKASLSVNIADLAANANGNAMWDIVAPTNYEITQGQNGKYTRGSSVGLNFTANGDYSKFTNGGGVYVDGAELSGRNYSSQSGSTVITLNAAYLETLSAGRHTLRINFSDGYAETNFTVQAAAVPATGDSAQPLLWLGLMLLAGAGLAVSAARRRKKQNV